MNRTILILEDDPNRIAIFKSCLGQKHYLTVVTEAADAIKALQEDEFDIIFLDHDLGGETYVSTDDKNTGSEVVRWMCEHSKYPHGYNTPIVIHSLNTPAATSMYNQLAASGMICQRIPFTLLAVNMRDPDFIQ